MHLHVHQEAKMIEGQLTVVDGDDRFLDEAPRLFAIVADPEDDGHPCVVAWGHELPDQAVVSWRLSNGTSEVAVFKSAEAALATAELLYPARLVYTAPPSLQL
jgi:hypothetical protein